MNEIKKRSIPLRRIVSGIERISLTMWYEKWGFSDDYSFILESGQKGRYSYIGKAADELIKGKNGVNTLQRGLSSSQEKGDPFIFIEKWLNARDTQNAFSEDYWTGGACGYLSYDLVRWIECLPEKAIDDLELPDYLFMLVKDLIVVDHELHQVILIAWYDEENQKAACEEKLIRLEQLIHQEAFKQKQSEDDQAPSNSLESFLKMEITDSYTQEAFVNAVNRIKSYITAGDVFQVNLSTRRSVSLEISPFAIYQQLRQVNPSPYMGFLKFKELTLVSSSPELLIKRKGKKLFTRPIAGTRKRGKTTEEDQLLREELLANEKERAEHVMLVDLERNDLGKVAAYGTVQVPELMGIEEYSHVMHLVSQVEAELAAGKGNMDIIKALFPGGTITGAPKVRTLEIIEELEPFRRGTYTGSFGWIDFNDNMEMNIIIRTLLMCGGKGYVQCGAGIVSDSIPEREFKESLRKGEALWTAVKQAFAQNPL